MRFTSLPCLLLCFATTAASAGPLLDGAFGNAGLRVLDGIAGHVQGIGSCPHADGSISLVAYRPSSASLLIVRLRRNGSLDTGFSDDGIHELGPIGAFATERSAVACTGLGNASPTDDRAMVVGAIPGTWDRFGAGLLDLHTGGYDPGFYLGGFGQYDISGLIAPPVNGVRPYPRVSVAGVFPAPGNGWLVVGRLDGHSSGVPAGMVALMNAGGALDAFGRPVAGGFQAQEYSLARVGADGDIRVLGTGTTAGGPTWGLLRLAAATLEPVALLGNGTPDGMSYRVLKGRQIGGGIMVAAALDGDQSAFGASPEMLVVRGDQVSEVALPAPAPLDGQVTGPSGGDSSAAATGAVAGRAVFAMGLRTLSQASAGYYVAMVRLGDGAGVPDQVEPLYGSSGSGSFRFQPSAGCTAGSAPWQRFNNVSSWGEATLMVGTVQQDCTTSSNQAALAARLATDTDTLLRNGFE